MVLQYEDKDYLDILHKLVSLTKTHPDLVSSVGLCNFDSEHVEEACEHLISKVGAPSIVSNQVQVRLTAYLFLEPPQLMFSPLLPCSSSQ